MPSGPGIVFSFTGLILMTALFSTASADPPKQITDFSREPGSLEWFVINDDVMGGRSSGEFELDDGNLMFTGSANSGDSIPI